jgi:radical SAM superfamily enzyme with C-terminal helix-hairpin-helix motif
MLKVAIIDGYVDEPTCLGVPPYISPYPRYIAGAIWSYDKNAVLSYYTIDQIRNRSIVNYDIKKNDLIVVIAGTSVPGRYLSGFPVSPYELIELLSGCQKPLKILTGPAAKYGFGLSGGKKPIKLDLVEKVFDAICKGDGEIFLYNLLKNHLELENIDINIHRKSPNSIASFATIGAKIVRQHPFFPYYLITEIETYRGCSRFITGGCSFCIEPLKGSPKFRLIKDIINEIRALYSDGIRHFRIGNQPCIFSYGSKYIQKEEFPKPNPPAIEKLFKTIRKIAPRLKTLHIDNANPGIIARYPEECKIIAKIIVKYHTSGDVAAMGVESVDPFVIKKNNLKADEDQVIEAIKIINEIGRKRGINGMPELLPGLNFLVGLIGETKKTFELNFLFLKRILNQNLLLRRINLRQIIPIIGTKIYRENVKIKKKNKHFFISMKRRIKTEIEQPMLKKIIPANTILKNVFTEKLDGRVTFGRQIGSYPILVGIPGVLKLCDFTDVKIIDYGFRSVTGIPFPLNINTADRKTLEAIPGIGKKRAIKILLNRPFQDLIQLKKCFEEDEIFNQLQNYVKL